MRLSPDTVTVVPADTARAWIRTGSRTADGLPDKRVTANSHGSPPGELADLQLSRLSRSPSRHRLPLIDTRHPRPSQAGGTVSLASDLHDPWVTGPIRQLTTSV